MTGGYQFRVQSNEALHFTEALTQNQISANYDLQLPSACGPVIVQAEVLVSVQNLAYEVWLFNRAVNLTSDPATDGFVGMWQFGALAAGFAGWTVTPAAGGGANPLFRQFIAGLAIPYTDRDNVSTPNAPLLHCRLINRSATAKNAGATGELVVSFLVSQQGFQA